MNKGKIVFKCRYCQEFIEFDCDDVIETLNNWNPLQMTRLHNCTDEHLVGVCDLIGGYVDIELSEEELNEPFATPLPDTEAQNITDATMNPTDASGEISVKSDGTMDEVE